MTAFVHAFRNRLGKLTQSEVARRLMANFFSLSLMQFVSNLVHLVTIPHILHQIGYGRYGVITVAFALTQYLVTFTDYGFNLTATREISINRHSTKRIGRIVSNVLAAKLVLMVVGFIFLAMLTYLVPRWRAESFVFLTSYLIVVGQVLYPLWYFQGIELMRLVTIFNVTTRFLYGILVFTLITEPGDYAYVNLYNGLCHLVTGVLSLTIAAWRFRVGFLWPGVKGIAWAFRASWHTFVSYFLNNIFVNSYLIILDMVAGNKITGQFAVVDRITSGIRQLYNVAFQVTFPHSSRLAMQDAKAHQAFLRRVRLYLAGMYLLVIAGVMVYADAIILLFTKAEDPLASQLLRVLVFMPLVVGLAIKAYQNMLIYEKRKLYSSIFIGITAFSLTSTTVLTVTWGAYGTAISMLLTEVVLSALLIFFDRTKVSGTW